MSGGRKGHEPSKGERERKSVVGTLKVIRTVRQMGRVCLK